MCALKTAPALAWALISIVGISSAQDAAKTMHFTVRDFSQAHPDFQYDDLGSEYNTRTCNGGVKPNTDFEEGLPHTGMVEPMLDENRKPVYTGKCPNLHFDTWFTDGVGDPTRGAQNTYCVPLMLTRIPGKNTYQFSSGDQGFFPIDDVPSAEANFDKEGNRHNYHFTMEAHTHFLYRGGEEFSFTGDDDVWVFINGQLAIDLGGIHLPASDTIRLDEQAARLGLTVGKYYSFDMFYCERQTTGSNLTIVTSIDLLPATAGGLKITDERNNPIPGGDTLVISETIPAWLLKSWTVESKNVKDKCSSYEVTEDKQVSATWTVGDQDFGAQPTVTLEKGDRLEPGAVYQLRASYNNDSYTAWVSVTGKPRVKAPIASPAGQSFSDQALSVDLSCETPGATIYYTTDGTDPTRGSAVYGSPISVSQDMVIKAFAVKADMDDSRTITEEYVKEVSASNRVSPNPFVPGTTPLPPEISSAPNAPEAVRNMKTGALVIFEAKNVSSATDIDFSGSAIITDAVGNIVASDLPVVTFNGAQAFIAWDGRNKQGRYVGGGAYLAVMDVVVNGKEKTYRKMIGVQHR